jgi:hypothetical protein
MSDSKDVDTVEVWPETHVTMNAWSEEVIDADDMHRRCAAHREFLANNPDAVAFAQDWADRNLDDLVQR